MARSVDKDKEKKPGRRVLVTLDPSKKRKKDGANKNKERATMEAKEDKDLNVFDNPEAALEEGSAANLTVLKGNDIELPEEELMMDSGEASALRDKIKGLVDNIAKTYWELSECLAQVQEKKAYKNWGYNTFDKYIEAEIEFAERRKAYYLIKMYKYYTQDLKSLITDKEQYQAALDAAKTVGWTKAVTVANKGIINNENIDEITKKVRDLPVRDLKVFCDTVYDSMNPKEQEAADDAAIKTVKKHFQLALPQAEDVRLALEKAETMLKDGGTERQREGHALSLICQDFLATHTATPGSKESVVTLLSKYESILGISIIAVDKAKGKIVMGEATLGELADLGANAQEGEGAHA